MHIRVFSMVVTVAFILPALTAGHAQTFSVIYNFGTNSGDPLDPQASGVIAQGRDGNLYSAAVGGTGAGTVFKITPQGTLSVIYDFDGAHGYSPVSGLTLSTDGNFYGATLLGGTSDEGTLFKITADGTLPSHNQKPGNIPSVPQVFPTSLARAGPLLLQQTIDVKIRLRADVDLSIRNCGYREGRG
jgi:uncharacterized repeat protein (TIGR03803 family)